MNSIRRGFTLIELLVVIAIIGILSSVVLAALSAARSKGNDAAVKSNLTNARAQAELFYSENNNQYVGTAGTANDVCAQNASANGTKGTYSFLSSAASASGVSINTTVTLSGSLTTATCHATPSSGFFNPTNGWAMNVPLKGAYPGITNPFYCVDNSGLATTTSGNTLAGSDASCL